MSIVPGHKPNPPRPTLAEFFDGHEDLFDQLVNGTEEQKQAVRTAFATAWGLPVSKMWGQNPIVEEQK